MFHKNKNKGNFKTIFIGKHQPKHKNRLAKSPIGLTAVKPVGYSAELSDAVFQRNNRVHMHKMVFVAFALIHAASKQKPMRITCN